MPISSTLIDMIERSMLKIPELPRHYEERVFVGGNYNDMPNLRKIVDYIRDTNFKPILAFDTKDVPKSRIYHFDIALIKLCKYAIFEVSTGNGHMMEIDRAVNTLGTVVFAVYKVRSSMRRKPSEEVSTMLTTLGVPMLPYHDDNRLREIMNMIFPSINEDPKSTWLNIIQRSNFNPFFKSWFYSYHEGLFETLSGG